MLLATAGWIVSSIQFAATGYAVLQSVIEKENRAPGWFALGFLPPALIWIILLFPLQDFGNTILLIYVGSSLLLLVVLLLPVPFRRDPIIRSPVKRIDERDAVFHRFYRLTKGTPEWNAFYQDHPELKTADEKIRTLPQLQEPGSRSFDPVTSQFTHAAFDMVEPLAKHLDEPDGPRANPVEIGPEEAAARLCGFARHLGAVSVGTTKLNPAWIYSHVGRGPGTWGSPIALNHQWAIAIAVKMDHGMMHCAPENTVITESAVKYAQAALIARILERTVKRWGHSARAHIDSNYRVMCIPIAVDAGLGEIGRHGLLMTPGYGSMVRLAVVTTDLVLAQSDTVKFGVECFCASCMKCVRNCPSHAISNLDRQLVNGVKKWQIDRESCYRFWRHQGTDCGLCIRVCPYSHPDNPLHRTVRWLLKKNRLLVRPAIAFENILYGKHVNNRPDWPAWHAPSID